MAPDQRWYLGPSLSFITRRGCYASWCEQLTRLERKAEMSSQEKQETLEIVASALQHEADNQGCNGDPLSEKLSELLDRIAANVRGRILPT